MGNILINHELSSKQKLAIFLMCFACIMIINWFDTEVVGAGMTFVLVYIVPISLASWFAGIRYGIIIALISSFSWLDVYITHRYAILLSSVAIANIFIKFSIFMSYAVLIGSLKEAVKREKAIARTDDLTGLANSRAFLDALAKEIDRSTRYERVVSMIYMDLDNFKLVNDTHGHHAGDKALKETARVLASVFRATDTAARMGGDEFAVLLPETDSESAVVSAGKLVREFQNMSEINQWPITLSIGVATFTNPPKDKDAILKLADDLMYSVKKSGKNRIQSGVMVK